VGWGADTTHIHSILLQLIVILWLVTNLFLDCTETDGHASHGQIYHRHRRDSSWPTAVCTPTGAAGPLPPSLQVRYESPLYQWEHAISLVSRSRKHPGIAHHVYADSTLWHYRWTSCPCPGSQAEGKPLPHLVVKQQDIGNSPACHAYLVYLQCKPWYEPRPLSVSRLALVSRLRLYRPHRHFNLRSSYRCMYGCTEVCAYAKRACCNCARSKFYQ